MGAALNPAWWKPGLTQEAKRWKLYRFEKGARGLQYQQRNEWTWHPEVEGGFVIVRRRCGWTSVARKAAYRHWHLKDGGRSESSLNTELFARSFERNLGHGMECRHGR